MAVLAQLTLSLCDFVVKEVWSKLAPGGCITARRNDYFAWHHRLLVAPARSGRYAALTTDADVYAGKCQTKEV